jgi:hypothetical protein
MDAAADCKSADTFYRAEEGGEMMSWRINGRRRVEFFNAFVLRTREEGATPISKGKRSTQGDSWFHRGGVIGGCSGATVCGSGCQPDSNDV